MNNIENEAITIERTPDFFQAARQLSDYIKALPLDQPTNDRLIALMIDQVQQAEKGAFAHGFRMGGRNMLVVKPRTPRGRRNCLANLQTKHPGAAHCGGSRLFRFCSCDGSLFFWIDHSRSNRLLK